MKPDSSVVVPSLWDRMLAPTPVGRAARVREIKAALRRDIENLLNTRWRCKTLPPGCAALEKSLVNYGIPDITRLPGDLAMKEAILVHEIREALARFEPRLEGVDVERVPNMDDYDRTFRFRITGVLRLSSHVEPISYDTSLEPTTSAFTVA